MNIATIKVAEMVGYDSVVRLAKAAGLNDDIQATPAMALGAYETTPLEMAGAYTIFANQGMYVKPNWVSSVRAKDGSVLYARKPETRQVLDPRVSYLMVNLMEEVMRSGTAAAVRARGFTVPAAGKTGSSRDGWFAGFTSELLCVVWVGFDDNSDLKLEGAHSALPIWTEFMKRALLSRQYRDAKPCEAPDGVVSVTVDSQTGMPATPFCPETRNEVFIAGTQPVGTCPLHGGGRGATYATSWDAPAMHQTAPAAVVASADPASHKARPQSPNNSDASPASQPDQASKPAKRKGVFRRLLDVFK
jgi:penicillin-binding protein 1B